MQDLRQVLGNHGLAWSEAILLEGVPPNPHQGLTVRAPSGWPVECIGIRSRDHQASPEVIDLGEVLNEPFDDPASRYTAPRERPFHFPLGRVQVGGTEFDFRGFVRVGDGGEAAGGRHWPSVTRSVTLGIRMNGLIHVGALLGEGDARRTGADVRMRIRWSDGETREWTMTDGLDGLGPWYGPAEAKPVPKLVWEGISEVSEKRQALVRLYRYRWVNPRPEVVVDSISWVSDQPGVGVRIVGLTRF
jgi:hypothetical protein